MLGTGTQADPYMITTVAEFRSMNDINAYYKLANNLDVNDSEWATGWTKASVKFLQLDGNGCEIKNINSVGQEAVFEFPDPNTYPRVKVLNLTFSNLIIIGSGSFWGAYNNYYTPKLSFTNCKFSIICNTTNNFLMDKDTGLNTKFINCSFAISGKCKSIINANSGECTNCFFDVDINAVFGSDTYYLIGYNATCQNVYVKGKVALPSDNNNDFRILSKPIGQCYAAIKIEDASESRLRYFTNSLPSTACFYDKELAGITMEAQTNVHALTTAQCKDKDYLNSIGFVVV